MLRKRHGRHRGRDPLPWTLMIILMVLVGCVVITLLTIYVLGVKPCLFGRSC